MALFKRKKSSTGDINDYYASERRRRIGMAWVLGFATLVLTVLIALGLFYGGRWVYRTVFDDEPNNVTEQQDGEGSEQQPVDDSNENADPNGLLDGFDIDEETNEDQPADDPEQVGDESTAGEDTADDSHTQNLPSSGATELPSTGPSEPEV